MQKRVFALITIAMLVVAASARFACAQDAPSTAVLSLAGNWRAFYVLQGPFVRDGGKLKQVGDEVDTPGPPADWRAVDFDDSTWHRLRGMPCQPNPYGREVAKANAGFVYLDGSSAFQSLICLRGRFAVTDPAKAKDLSLSVEYRGGVVVHLNGVEVARGHMPAGKVASDTLAEDYPMSALSGADGKLPVMSWRKRNVDTTAMSRIRRRVANVTVPARLLRLGTNVLSVEVHRSPYPAAYEAMMSKRPYAAYYQLLRSTCGITELTLTSPDGRHLVANVVRPKGMQVWNSSVFVRDPYDFGDPEEPLRPVAIAACRNGAFSGEVSVGSRTPIRKLATKVSDLVALKTKAVLPASAVRIRYGSSTTPPEEVKVVQRSKFRSWTYAEAPAELPGATQAITLTVRVPKTATPGTYTGALTITAEGGGPFTVPVKLEVSGYVLPDPKDYESVVDIIQSPDTLAMHYAVPLWSDAHWKLIDRSFEVLGTAGLDTIYIPMIAETHFGNAQSMARWVKRADGKYDCDFSVLEKYLDAYEKHNGKPRIVCLYVWDLSLEGGADWVNATGGFMRKEDIEERKRLAKLGLGPVVTVLDAAAGKAERLQLPQYSDAKSLALWKPIYEGLRERLRIRGMLDRVMLGIPLDPKPTKGVVDLFRKLMPGTPWLVQDHIYVAGEKIHGVPVVYQANVFFHGVNTHDVRKSRYGMKRPDIRLHFPRSLSLGKVPINHRLLVEKLAFSGLRGIARVGGDMWPVMKGKRGRGRGLMITHRYTKANAGGLGVWVHILQPGDESAVATDGFEMLREGVQETEARVFIERAVLLDGIIKGDLAQRCREMLVRRNRAVLIALTGKINDRHRFSWWEYTGTYGFPGYARSGYLWHLSSGHEARTKELFDLAAEVAAKSVRP